MPVRSNNFQGLAALGTAQQFVLLVSITSADLSLLCEDYNQVVQFGVPHPFSEETTPLCCQISRDDLPQKDLARALEEFVAKQEPPPHSGHAFCLSLELRRQLLNIGWVGCRMPVPPASLQLPKEVQGWLSAIVFMLLLANNQEEFDAAARRVTAADVRTILDYE